MKRKPVSIQAVAKRLSADEVRLNEYKQMEREMLGIYDYIDDDNVDKTNFSQYTKVFNTYEEYYKARTKAELLINEGKSVPEPLRSKLIQVKNDLKQGNMHI